MSDVTLAKEIWHLTHSEGLPMKKVASKMGIAISRAYELLAEERRRRDANELRQSASFAIALNEKR